MRHRPNLGDRQTRRLRVTLVVIGRAALVVLLAAQWMTAHVPSLAVLSVLAAGILVLGWLDVALQLIMGRRGLTI